MREGAPSTRPKRSVMRGEWQALSDDNEGRASERRRRRASIGVFFGLVLVQRLFFDKHSIGVCIAFALYRLYWGLVFSAFSASDVIVGTGFWFLILCVGLVWFGFFFFFFFFWESVGLLSSVICWACHGLDVGFVVGLPFVVFCFENPWACCLLCYKIFFFQILVLFFFWGFFFGLKVEQIKKKIYLRVFLILIKGVSNFFF